MISLFLDTHSKDLNIGLLKNDKFDEIKLKDLESHSNLFLCKVDELLNKNNIMPNDIDNIIVINGPGSFTGIRIAVTCAKVYAYMLKKDIYTISSLKSYALSQDNCDYVVSLIDARRGYVYAGIYDKSCNEVMEESYILFDDLQDKVKKLSGTIKYTGFGTFNNISISRPDLHITRIIESSIKNGTKENPHMVNPKYLKKTEAEEKNDKACE